MSHDLAKATAVAAMALCRRKRAQCVCHRFPDKCHAVEQFASQAAATVTALDRAGLLLRGDYSPSHPAGPSEAWADIKEMV